MIAALVMLETLDRFINYIVQLPDDVSFVSTRIAECKAELLELLNEVVGQDFDLE